MSSSPQKDHTKARPSIENFVLYCDASPHAPRSPTKVASFPCSLPNISHPSYSTPKRAIQHIYSPSAGNYNISSPKITSYTPIAGGFTVQSPSNAQFYSSPNVKSGFSVNTKPNFNVSSSEIASPSSYKATTPLNYTLEAFPSFLGRIGTGNHQEMNRLYQLSTLYSSARVLPESDETIFNAACCCFFEKTLTIESYDMMNSSLGALFTQDEWLHSQLFLFVTLLKGLTYDSNNSSKIQKFYDAISRDSSLYQKGVIAFKEVVAKLVKEIESSESTYLRASYRWMNDFDKIGQDFFRRFAQVLQVNLKFLILNTSNLQEESFYYNKGTTAYDVSPISTMNTKEFVIFYQKSANQAYLLSSSSVDTSYSSRDLGLNDLAFIKSNYTSVTASPYKSAQEVDSSYKVQPFTLDLLNSPKENQSEYIYGSINNKKPRVSIDTFNVKSTSLYNSPLAAPTSLPKFSFKSEHLKSPSINLDSDYANSPYEPSSALGSNWLSNNTSISDIPSNPEISQGSFLENTTLFNDSGLQPKIKLTSPLNAVRSISEGKFGPAPQTTRNKPWKQGGLLDQLDNAYLTPQVLTPNRLVQKNQHFFQDSDDKRRHSSRGSTFSKEAQLVKESLFSKENNVEKRFSLQVEKKPILPENLTAKLRTVNQKLDSHNFEFGLMTNNHLGKQDLKYITGLKQGNLNGLMNTYNDLMARKSNSSPLKSGSAYVATAMRMDS